MSTQPAKKTFGTVASKSMTRTPQARAQRQGDESGHVRVLINTATRFAVLNQVVTQLLLDGSAERLGAQPVRQLATGSGCTVQHLGITDGTVDVAALARRKPV